MLVQQRTVGFFQSRYNNRRVRSSIEATEIAQKERSMKIAIIGAGNVGGALAKAAIAGGHEVAISASSPEVAAQAAQAAGATAARSNAEVVANADIVILAVPYAAVQAIAQELGDALTEKIVVDSTNPLDETGRDLLTSGISAAEGLQAQLPGTKVVKAFNTIFAGRHARPSEEGRQLDAFIASDDADAKAKVGEFARSLG
ncbi:MAG: NADP oxidoreductase [Actinomycetota bacterium]|nr:MAG: NADP oxidoreductase [Actinomycetota bacterium]